jgi:hypothetical protein
MKTTPGRPLGGQLFRELVPGDTFQHTWKGKPGDYLTTDLIRAEPQSGQPWDFRAAVNVETGEAIWLPAIQTVTPTDMGAGPT